MADVESIVESDPLRDESVEQETGIVQVIERDLDNTGRLGGTREQSGEICPQRDDNVGYPGIKVTDNGPTEDAGSLDIEAAATNVEGEDALVPVTQGAEEPDDEETQRSLLAAAGVDTGSRASISLQRVASVEEIRSAMARAEQGRPRSRRRRQESETMRQWRMDFEERLRVKDELEAEAIEELKREADRTKEEWYAQWRAEVAERREVRRVEEQEAADALQESNNNATCWQRMSRIAKSLNTRRESKDLNRMRTLLIALEKPPKRTVAT